MPMLIPFCGCAWLKDCEAARAPFVVKTLSLPHYQLRMVAERG